MGEVTGPETHVLVGKRSFIAGYETCNEDGSINVVVEIPTGRLFIIKGGIYPNPG
jgi:hypothetical protein